MYKKINYLSNLKKIQCTFYNNYKEKDCYNYSKPKKKKLEKFAIIMKQKMCVGWVVPRGSSSTWKKRRSSTSKLKGQQAKHLNLR